MIPAITFRIFLEYIFLSINELIKVEKYIFNIWKEHPKNVDCLLYTIPLGAVAKVYASWHAFSAKKYKYWKATPDFGSFVNYNPSMPNHSTY